MIFFLIFQTRMFSLQLVVNSISLKPMIKRNTWFSRMFSLQLTDLFLQYLRLVWIITFLSFSAYHPFIKITLYALSSPMIIMHGTLHELVIGDFKQKTPSSPRVVLILCILGREGGGYRDGVLSISTCDCTDIRDYFVMSNVNPRSVDNFLLLGI